MFVILKQTEYAISHVSNVIISIWDDFSVFYFSRTPNHLK